MDGNSGANYAVTFVARCDRGDHAAGHHGDGADSDTKVYDGTTSSSGGADRQRRA